MRSNDTMSGISSLAPSKHSSSSHSLASVRSLQRPDLDVCECLLCCMHVIIFMFICYLPETVYMNLHSCFHIDVNVPELVNERISVCSLPKIFDTRYKYMYKNVPEVK